MKAIRYILLLLPLLIWANKPCYLSENYRFDNIPLDAKSLNEMWLKRKTSEEDSFKLKCNDIIAQLQYQNRDIMDSADISYLVQFRNMDDLMRTGPMYINASAWFEYRIIGYFSYKDHNYLIYDIDYAFNGYSRILACLSNSSPYPPSLIIAGEYDESKYASFQIDTLKNEIIISRIFCTEFLLKKISRYSMEGNFRFIDERTQIIKNDHDSIWKIISDGGIVDVDKLDGWIDYDRSN